MKRVRNGSIINYGFLSKIGTGIFVMAALFVMTGFGAWAAENTQMAEEAQTEETAEQIRFTADTVWEAASDVTVREEPDDSAKTVGKLEAGTSVVVSEDEKDGWCKVRNQTLEGYVQTSELQTVNASSAEEINQEFGVNEEFESMVLEEYEYLQRQRRTSIIWGVVIGVLVAAIFAVGVVSAVRGNKAEQGEENEETEEKAEQEEKTENEEKADAQENDSDPTQADTDGMKIEEIGEDDQ